METKVLAAGATGVVVGAGQTALLREYVDRVYPTTNIEALGTFGTPSALAGMGGGALALGIGAYGAGKAKDGRQRISDIYVEAAIDYGAAALVSGILSGWKPAVTEADCIAAGGFFYNGSCHKTPQTGTVSMAPHIQTAAYRPPLSPSYNRMEPDMNVLNKMTAEIARLGEEVNRLGHENTQLKIQSPASYVEQPGLQPGTVSAKQARYGFMDPNINSMIAPGHPTDRAKAIGFMDTGGNTPIAKVQQMKDRYGFSG
ncbi:MAG: hypothetical protein PHZ02_01175 [Desulfocapsaceae bacterium]|nr:hypothetical protein [Desulfocapsaceae bacterium]